MPPKPNKRRSCTGKTKYLTLADASRAAAKYAARQHSWLTAYPCRFCGGFHFGHPPKRVRQSIIDRQRNARKPAR